MRESDTSLILLVDDNPNNLQVLGHLLEGAYRTAISTNGLEALAFVQKRRPDLILLDIMMPEMDGFEFCKKLKECPTTQDIPVIFLTAKTETEDVITGFELGAVDYIMKPFRKEELLARVRTHLKLKRTEEQLRHANEAKDKFFSIIAHDLKNPINALMGFSNVFLSYYDSLDKTARKGCIEDILESTSRISKLLENLLEWSRLRAGTMEWTPGYVDLQIVVLETIALLSVNAGNKNITVSSSIADETIVFADRNMVSTIFRNLVSNAIKFTHAGGEVRISSESKKNYEEITVADNGVGITLEKRDRLFKINNYHSTSGTENESGTGLGLILCKECVEKNSGRIWVESEQGKGSKFCFTLPGHPVDPQSSPHTLFK